MDRPQTVRDMAKAVFEPTEDAIVDPLFRLANEKRAKLAIHGGTRLRVSAEQERQIDEAEFRHAVGEVARRLVAERDRAILNHRQDVFGFMAVIHDVVDVVYGHVLAEL